MEKGDESENLLDLILTAFIKLDQGKYNALKKPALNTISTPLKYFFI